MRSEKTCRTVQDAVDFIMDECKNKDMRIDRLVKENKKLTDDRNSQPADSQIRCDPQAKRIAV